MSGNTKSSDKRLATRLITDLRHKLEVIDCPLIEEVDEEWIYGLLFHPSEARAKLISWLVSLFDPKFEEILNNKVYAATTKVESRVQKLLFICHVMGLCSTDDLDIIKGSASERKQSLFWHNLLDLAIVNQASYKKGNSTNRHTTEMYQNCCRFVDTLLRKNPIAGLFQKSVTLFPPDISKQLDRDKKEKRTPLVPDQALLKDTIEKLEHDSHTLARELEMLRSKQSTEDIGQPVIENICKKLDLAFKMNAQHLASFCLTYDHELEAWCSSKPKLKRSGLSDAVDEVHERIMEYNQCLEGMENIRRCHSAVRGKIRQDIQQVLKSTDNDLSKQMLAEMRHDLQVLEESLQRPHF